jgi:hypothetical protein
MHFYFFVLFCLRYINDILKLVKTLLPVGHCRNFARRLVPRGMGSACIFLKSPSYMLGGEYGFKVCLSNATYNARYIEDAAPLAVLLEAAKIKPKKFMDSLILSRDGKFLVQVP